MAKILILAPSGFGKSTSIGNIPELEIKGLNPKESYIISVTSKPLPFRGSNAVYPKAEDGDLTKGKRLVTNDPKTVADALEFLATNSPFKNIVIDDFNYLMQDYYMDNALLKGWDAPKKIGFDMNKIFKAIEICDSVGKNVIILAHGEDVIKPDGRIYTKLKTTGKMVDEYVTPEGKFSIVLLGISSYDSVSKKIKKQFLTTENASYSSAKAPIGMFKDEFIPNDLGLVVKKIENYYD